MAYRYMHAGTILKRDGEEIDAWFAFEGMNKGSSLRIKWAQDATGTIPLGDIHSDGRPIDAVKWKDELSNGWCKHLDLSIGKWKANAKNKGEAMRKSFLEDAYCKVIGDPREKSKDGESATTKKRAKDEKKEKSEKRNKKLKKENSNHSGQSKSSNPSATIPGTSIRTATDHINPDAYKMRSTGPIRVIQEFLDGELFATRKKDGQYSTMDIIESAFFDQGVRIDPLDANLACNDVFEKKCKRITDSQHWHSSSWSGPSGGGVQTRLGQLLSGETPASDPGRKPTMILGRSGANVNSLPMTDTKPHDPEMQKIRPPSPAPSANSDDIQWNPRIFFQTRYKD
jgi:hypothetical protein